jgi:hypothetical protein
VADILEFLTVQCTPQGFRTGAHVAALSTNGGQDPQNFSNDLVPFGGFENTSLNLAWRAYDRTIRHYNDVNGIEFWAYQQNFIYQLLPPNWPVAHTIGDQATNLDSGVHTGLYHVTQEDGTEHLCGLYSRAGGGTGWVRYDPRANTWASGSSAAAFSQSSVTMGKCVQWRGRLFHPNASGLQAYDPITDIIEDIPSTNVGTYAKLAVVQDRLFILPDAGAARLMEYAFGVIYQAASLAAQPFGATYTLGGDNILITGLPGITTDLLAIWNCQSGGSGFRAHEITVPSSVPASSVTASENSVIVPDGSPLSLDFTGYGPPLSYANGPAAANNDRWQFTEGGWNLVWGPLFSGTPQAFLMLKINFGSFTAGAPVGGPPPPYPPPWNLSSFRIDWNGSGAVMNYVNVDPLDNGFSVSFSQNSSPWGSSSRMFANDGPSVTAIKIEPYSDGAVSRGLRMTFRIASSTATIPNTGGNLYFGFGRSLTRPDTRCALSTGSNPTTYPGGVASFDSVNNRLINVPPTGAGRTTLEHDAPVGSGFQVGEAVTGLISGATGVIGILSGSVNRMFVHGGSSFPFQSGEQITGSISGTTANLTTAPDDSPTYQIIWSLDSQFIPELEFVSLQGAHWVTESSQGYATGPNYQLQILTFETLSEGEETPETTQSGVPESGPSSAATVATTQSGVPEASSSSAATPATTQSGIPQSAPESSATPLATQSGVPQAIAETSATPETTQSGVPQTVPEAAYPPNIYARVPSKAHTQPGWVNVQVNDADVGGDQPGTTRPARPRSPLGLRAAPRSLATWLPSWSLPWA